MLTFYLSPWRRRPLHRAGDGGGEIRLHALLLSLPLALGWLRLGTVGRGAVWAHAFSMLAVLGWLS
jgi:hypothetical protein